MFKELPCECCGVVGPVLVNRHGAPAHCTGQPAWARCFACRVRCLPPHAEAEWRCQALKGAPGMAEIDMTNVRLMNALTDQADLIADVTKALTLMTNRVEALYARMEALEAQRHVHAVGSTVTQRPAVPREQPLPWERHRDGAFA